MNIEHRAILDEQAPNDEFDEMEQLEDKYDTEKIRQRLANKSLSDAEAYLKKHKREITRLKKHAEKCLLTDNYDGYAYALRKLRAHYRQPCTEELIRTTWNITRKQIFKIIDDAKEQGIE